MMPNDYVCVNNNIGSFDMTNHHPHQNDSSSNHNHLEKITWMRITLVYLSYVIQNLFGRFRDFLRNSGFEKSYANRELERNRFLVPLFNDYEAFYVRNIYKRISDLFNRPLCSYAGSLIMLKDRISTDNKSTFSFTGTETEAINFGSYNYLGFAENTGICHQENIKIIKKCGVSLSGCRQENANYTLQRVMERLVAEFVNQEDAVCFGMGFATNALNIPVIADKHCCIISDALNHTSLILGIRMSGATIFAFKHNDINDLEKQIRKAIIHGRPRTRRPFNMILVVVEGIYSMEGTIVDLPAILKLKSKYKFYIFLDEAHSIGALGPSGGGTVDYYNLQSSDVDLAMGTFTKSFASAGGYIAGKKKLIEYIRCHSYSTIYAISIPPVLTMQIITSLNIIMGKINDGEGKLRLLTLHKNTRYFRSRLQSMGLLVYGHMDSPVVPVIVYYPGKLPIFSRMCLNMGLAVVMVGFPACPLLLTRARFCLSSGHSMKDIEKALSIIESVSKISSLMYNKK